MRKNSHRGAILLLTLAAITLLAIVAVELSHRARIDVLRAVQCSRHNAKRRAFQSGVEVAKAVLTNPIKNQVVYFGESWAELREFDLDGMNVKVEVSDEAAKINFLSAVRENTPDAKKALVRLFASIRERDPEREEQWNAAEQIISERLLGNSNKRIAAKDLRTLDQLRELGISKDLVFRADKSSIALEQFLTLYGTKRVNVNTAPIPVLRALHLSIDGDIAKRIDMWRGGDREAESDLSRFRPFKTTRELELVDGIVQRATIDGKLKVVQNLFQKIQDKVTVTSNYFSVRLRVSNNSRAWEGRCYLERNAIGDVIVRSFEEIEQ